MDAMDASLTLVSDSSSTALANNSGVSIVSTNETLKVALFLLIIVHDVSVNFN